jgi:alpha-ketoglutarate-dependent taurine dioxygenase
MIDCEILLLLVGHTSKKKNTISIRSWLINTNFFVTVSQRGVVFFRAQDNMTIELQKEFVQRLGLLSGKPSDSHLHHHPILNKTAAAGTVDPHLSQISSADVKLQFDWQKKEKKPKRLDAARWHSDVHYETKPPDYSCLRMTKLPQNGGDTLWASGYDLYDRYSKPYQKFLDGLTTTNASDGYVAAAKADPERVKLFEGPRGAPENIGAHLTAVYPVVRTNPVTGWKSVFSVGPFSKRINELSVPESDRLLKEFTDTVAMHPEMQVRHKWRNPNDMGLLHASRSTPMKRLR